MVVVGAMGCEGVGWAGRVCGLERTACLAGRGGC